MKNPPAFPVPTAKYGEDGRLLHASLTDEHKGMALRDYFAAELGAASLIARAVLLASGASITGDPYDNLANDAYRYADAMLAERDKEPSR